MNTIFKEEKEWITWLFINFKSEKVVKIYYKTLQAEKRNKTHLENPTNPKREKNII